MGIRDTDSLCSTVSLWELSQCSPTASACCWSDRYDGDKGALVLPSIIQGCYFNTHTFTWTSRSPPKSAYIPIWYNPVIPLTHLAVFLYPTPSLHKWQVLWQLPRSSLAPFVYRGRWYHQPLSCDTSAPLPPPPPKYCRMQEIHPNTVTYPKGKPNFILVISWYDNNTVSMRTYPRCHWHKHLIVKLNVFQTIGTGKW